MLLIKVNGEVEGCLEAALAPGEEVREVFLERIICWSLTLPGSLLIPSQLLL
jgi:hypothetical protein